MPLLPPLPLRPLVRAWSPILLFAAVVTTATAPSAEREGTETLPAVFPGETWQRRIPREVGLDAARLAEFQAIVGGRGCITRHGYLVHSWGDYDKPADVASAVKPFYSYLLFKAIEEGKVASVDEKVVDWQPRLEEINAALGFKDRKMTFRHLANQTACLGFEEAPGTAYDYNDVTMGFFWDTLVNRVYGVPWSEAEAKVIAPRLSKPLRFEDGTPRVARRDKPGRFAVSARDFCRFGMLFLHQGNWNGEQILGRDLAVLSVSDPLPLSIPRTRAQKAGTIPGLRSIGGGANQTDHNGGYSWFWWLNEKARDGELWFRDVPQEFFACFGHGGQEGMAVLPREGIVVSWIGKRLHEDRERGNRAFRTLVDAADPRALNTERSTERLLSPEEARRGIEVPEGFRASLFAGEPHVRQPIALAFDPRGRLWVAENYTYAERAVNFETKLHDRVLILEDSDHDGRFDKRTVFWDRAQKLASVEIGFGGVFALCAPQLVFVPDADGDDVPDGEPRVLLDGWDDDGVRHNIANGLRWGPDGWLYGRHGILATSSVGRPGTADAERQQLNCGVWRYHPTDERFEVVSNGTTNPWGMDWDEHGQLFFINTVIGHLWHVVPGAHYERMYGVDFNPYLFGLIGQTADHVHWASSEPWQQAKKGLSDATDRAGGGHAHSGLMIYLGDNWPDRYRGDVFAINFHGRRVNRDRLVRAGAGYSGKHEPDFLKTSDPWFRGLEILYGPDGGAYIADWSDMGECHESDGVHRTSGRIYRVTHGQPPPPSFDDLTKQTDAQLVQLQTHKNDWYVRQARRILQERAAAGRDLGEARKALLALYESASDEDVPRKLRALWALNVTGELAEPWLLEQLKHPDEHIRVWSIRLLVERYSTSAKLHAALARTAGADPSGLVLTFTASALQELPTEHRWPIARRLAAREEFADDAVLPSMVWYGVEPAVPLDPPGAIAALDGCRMPRVRESIARRITLEISRDAEAVHQLVAELAKLARRKDWPAATQILTGMTGALRGRRQAPTPKDWSRVAELVKAAPQESIHRSIRALSVVFGDGQALDELRRIAGSDSADLESRRQAIEAIVQARADGLLPLLRRLIGNPDLATAAIRALGVLGHAETAKIILANFGSFRRDGRLEAVSTLAARPGDARVLLDAVEAGTIRRRDVSAFVLRKMQLLDEADITEKIAELWPDVRLLAGDKVKRIAEYRDALTPESLAAADRSDGRRLFTETCSKCHVLFGEGKKIGPDLTGGQRTNLQYLLENIVDPSATLADQYRMSILFLNDSRVINGVVLQRTADTLTVQSQDEQLVLPAADVRLVRESELSLMPEGLLDALKAEEVANLIAYLMSPRQVAPPEPAAADAKSAGADSDGE